MIRTRLAPSPTGEMHTGHLLHLIHIFGIARKLEADIVFRMEDHDRLRCRPEYAEQWKDDLQWLGFTDGTEVWSIQSEHLDRYSTLLDRLRESNLIYACTCSRKSIEERRLREGFSGSSYDGFCRDKKHPFAENSSIRLQLSSDTLSDNDIEPEQLPGSASHGDPLLRDNRGLFTYMFCVVVDDLIEGINLIIRGEDLLDSVMQQMQMRAIFAPLLGIVPGQMHFYHHPLLYDESGNKLSKSQRSLHLQAIREANPEIRPEQILAQAAQAGSLKASDILFASECQTLFNGLSL